MALKAARGPDRQSGSWDDDQDGQEFPLLDTAKSSALFGAFTGGAGFAVGLVMGTLRSKQPLIFASASGIQCLGLGFCYHGSRQGFLHAYDNDARKVPYVSAAAGSVSGVVMAALTRGRANIVPAAVCWGAVGFVGQKGLDYYHRQQLDPVPKTERGSIWDSSWSPLQKITDDDYEIMLKERLVRIDARIAIVDEDLAALKAEKDAKPAKDP